MTYDLHHHGDAEVGPGLVDLAVNVRLPSPPDWLLGRLTESLTRCAAYPDATAATAVVAARHGRTVAEVLVTAGAAEAFTLVARAFAPRRAVVVHPQFTEPEVALLAAGHRVERVVLAAADAFTLHPDAIPADADLVVVGNPTNPTSTLHPAATLRALARPGRVLVVDEAFMDAVPGETQSLAGPSRADQSMAGQSMAGQSMAGQSMAGQSMPGLLVVRSLTKTWGLAGIRAGYVVGDPDLVAALAAVQPAWSVSTPALVAVQACLDPLVVKVAADAAEGILADRNTLVIGLRALSDAVGPDVLTLEGDPAGPFVLVRVRDGASVRQALRDRGYAVRRGDTFPGLGPDHLRIAVRAPEVTFAFLAQLRAVLTGDGADAWTAPETQGAALPAGEETGWPDGHVVLVGAGPGSAGLLTVRARELLGLADVVVTDRLVPLASLAGLHPRVEVIDVSKTPRGHATPQERINELLVEHARTGRRVLRFKGGDSFVFGRGMEELQACAAAGLPVTVVPGISSSIAVPELAGIPVTHRGLSQGFTVLSAHVPPGDPRGTIDWGAVARTNTTLVLLMSVHTLADVAHELIVQGMSPDTPAACIEDGSLGDQRVLTATLATLARVAATAALRPPAITVIGPVAAFAQ